MGALFKAIPLGGLLTWLVCLFIGSSGSTGGFLSIRRMDVDIAMLGLSTDIYWSWTMFAIGTGISWVILFIME